MRTTVVIVDDHAPFRAVARALLESDGFDVIGEATDAREALILISTLHPRVLLLDVRLPDASGLDVSTALKDTPDSPMVVLTSTGDYEHAAAMCGAAGFIPKAMLTAALVRAMIGFD